MRSLSPQAEVPQVEEIDERSLILTPVSERGRRFSFPRSVNNQTPHGATTMSYEIEQCLTFEVKPEIEIRYMQVIG